MASNEGGLREIRQRLVSAVLILLCSLNLTRCVRSPHLLSVRQRDCAKETGPRREFCQQFLAPKNVKLFAEYQKLRESCKWEHLDTAAADLNFMYRWYPTDQSYADGRDSFVMSGRFNRERKKVPADMKSAKLQRCRQTVRNGPLVGEWVFERIGPMVGRGGNDWHQFMWANDYDNMGRRVEQEQEITGWYLSSVDKAGTPIRHPPLHAHHSHLNPEGCWYDPEDPLAGPQTANCRLRSPVPYKPPIHTALRTIDST